MVRRILKLGTRGSRLALEQARRVAGRLAGSCELRIIQTAGDRFAEQALRDQPGMGFFTKEIEEQLRERRIDLAVHSLKDLPTGLAPGLVLGAVLARDDPGDMLLARPDVIATGPILPLRDRVSVGTSSLRRQALLRLLRGDLLPVPMRGNVPTRVEKVGRGECAALVIARAGLVRLQLDPAPLLAFDLNPERWICSPGQGAIAVEVRADDREVAERIAPLDDPTTRSCVLAERTLLVAFGGGCHAPFGAWTRQCADGFKVSVAAPGADATFRVADFEAEELDRARAAAESWIRTGCPAMATPESEEWIVRPAQSWC